jgi:hypothetical protein
MTVREEHAAFLISICCLGSGFIFLYGGVLRLGFDIAYNDFIKKHKKQRRGERLRRLTEGHGHAEKLFMEQVWWPAFGHFDNLHPEYEINDFKDG